MIEKTLIDKIFKRNKTQLHITITKKMKTPNNIRWNTVKGTEEMQQISTMILYKKKSVRENGWTDNAEGNIQYQLQAEHIHWP